MDEINKEQRSIEQREPFAASELLPLVYEELRKLAAARLAEEKSGQTLQPTALVHEAYLRIVGDGVGQDWSGRGHFFAAAAEAMRRILINRARDKHRLKRGGERQRVEFDSFADPATVRDEDLLDLNDALDRLASTNPSAAELVKLRFFAGMTLPEVGTSLGLSPRSASRLWVFARAWLIDALDPR